eukprot:scaffold102525_cov72-Phaeocystis_antarctica.AAC.5
MEHQRSYARGWCLASSVQRASTQTRDKGGGAPSYADRIGDLRAVRKTRAGFRSAHLGTPKV